MLVRFRDFRRVRVRSGLLMISTLFGENSCGSLQTAPAQLLLPLGSAWMYQIAQSYDGRMKLGAPGIDSETWKTTNINYM
jgi:hypothetical protein